MNSVTVNDILASDLDIEAVRINLANQDEDYAELVLPVNYDSTLNSILQEGSRVCIKLGATVVFRGDCGLLGARADSGAEGKSIRVSGPWSQLSSKPFIKQVTDHVSGSTYWSSLCELSGSPQAMMTELLSFAVSSGFWISVGQIDLPTTAIPKLSLANNTIAQAIKSVLRWVPGAQTFFDYSSSVPAMYVLQQTASALRDINVETDGTYFSAVHRTDMAVGSVRLFYERQHTRSVINSSVNGTEPSTKSDGRCYIGEDNAGELADPRRMMFWHVLSGRKDTTIWNHSFGTSLSYAKLSSFTAKSDGWYQGIKVLLYLQGHLASKDGVIQSPYAGRYDYCVGYSFGALVAQTSCAQLAAGESSLWNLPNRTDYGGWRGLPPEGVWEASNLAIWKRTLITYWNSSTSFSDQNQFAKEIYVAAIRVGSSWVSPAGFTVTFTKDTTTDTLEAMPSGVAVRILSACGTAFYSGDVSLDYEQYDFMARNALYGGVKSPVQGVSIDLNAEVVKVSFGYPDHLGPDDFISLSKLK